MDRSWRALVVEKVSKEQLRWTPDGRIDIHGLPVELVHIASAQDMAQDMSRIAILSWRWDIEPGQISLNLHAAVLCANHAGFRYLLIDTISIDQMLDKESLLDEVVAFSQLYSSIPAIKAYEKLGESRWAAERRPWIFHELRLIKKSPHQATLVKHDRGFSAAKLANFPDNWSALSRQHEESYFQTVILVLCGTVSMADVTDFRFLIPAFSKLILDCHVRMAESDYLLTVALLSGLDSGEELWTLEGLKLQNIKYERFTFKRAWWALGLRHIVFLDGEKIGEWKIFLLGTRFDFVHDAEQIIFRKLGLTQEECDALAEREMLPSREITRPPFSFGMSMYNLGIWAYLLPRDIISFVDLKTQEVDQWPRRASRGTHEGVAINIDGK